MTNDQDRNFAELINQLDRFLYAIKAEIPATVLIKELKQQLPRMCQEFIDLYNALGGGHDLMKNPDLN